MMVVKGQHTYAEMAIMHTTFVASYLPPNPTSIMQTSTCIEFKVK